MKHPAATAAIVLALAALGLPAATPAETMTGANQEVVRLNPKRDPGKPHYTVANCLANEDCQSQLTQTLLQAGGNPALLAGAKNEARPRVSGDESIYRFAARDGESFCRAVLLKLSVAPNFGVSATELKFSASTSMVRATIRLPGGEDAPPRAWFDGMLLLFSVKGAAFSESACTLTDMAQEAACKGKCETIKF